MVFWTAQLAECVEENAGKPNQVGCYSGVFCPSTAIHAKVSHRLHICHSDPSVPGGDLPTSHSLVPESETAGPSPTRPRVAPVGMTNLRTVAHLGMGGGGWTGLS